MIVNGCLESLWIRDIEELIIFSNDDLIINYFIVAGQIRHLSAAR